MTRDCSKSMLHRSCLISSSEWQRFPFRVMWQPGFANTRNSSPDFSSVEFEFEWCESDSRLESDSKLETQTRLGFSTTHSARLETRVEGFESTSNSRHSKSFDSKLESRLESTSSRRLYGFDHQFGRKFIAESLQAPKFSAQSIGRA